MAKPTKPCPECNAGLVRVDAGWCCPNGHGRIVPHLTDAKLARLQMEPGGDPDAAEWYGVTVTRDKKRRLL